MRIYTTLLGVPKKCRLTIAVVFIVVTPQIQCKPVAELDSPSGNSPCMHHKRKLRGVSIGAGVLYSGGARKPGSKFKVHVSRDPKGMAS